MFRLTREVRFAIGADPGPPASPPANGFAGFPPLLGLGHYYALQVTLAGSLDSHSQYLLNIRQIDRSVRHEAIPRIERAIRDRTFGGGGNLLHGLFTALREVWHPATLERLTLCLSPFLAISMAAGEIPMAQLSQKFEFSASHRLYNPSLPPEENQALFGKCSNPYGHGHNYELQVTLRGEPDASGVLLAIPAFERIVTETVIDKFDHRNLNAELPEFSTLIPTVENIAMVIYRLLRPRFEEHRAHLASVTVWETPKTWCEYSEQSV